MSTTSRAPDDTGLPRAVLLDDNLMSASAVIAALRREGYRVATSSSVGAAERLIRQEPTSLLVVALGCARADAAGFIRSIRDSDDLSDLPILGYCGHTESELIEQGRAAGATLVAPNSAMRESLDRVLAAVLARRARAGDGEEGVADG